MKLRIVSFRLIPHNECYTVGMCYVFQFNRVLDGRGRQPQRVKKLGMLNSYSEEVENNEGIG